MKAIIHHWKLILILFFSLAILIIGASYYEKISNMFNFFNDDTTTSIESDIINYEKGLTDGIERINNLNKSGQENIRASEETIKDFGRGRREFKDSISEISEIRKEVNRLTGKSENISTELFERVERLTRLIQESDF